LIEAKSSSRSCPFGNDVLAILVVHDYNIEISSLFKEHLLCSRVHNHALREFGSRDALTHQYFRLNANRSRRLNVKLLELGPVTDIYKEDFRFLFTSLQESLKFRD
jgi:hypothetical protein